MSEGVPRSVVSWTGCIAFGAVICFLLLAVPCFFYFVCNPPERVKVTFRNVPLGTVHLSVIAETGGKLHNMNWSPRHILPGEMHPGRSTFSSWFPDEENMSKSNYFVAWRFGKRYGIVTRRTDKTWWVTWFDSTEISIEERNLFLGGGRADFDLSKGRTEPFPADKAQGLGLDGLEN